MAIEHRMAVLMLAGLDGDLSALAAKQWREFTPDEKLAIQVTIRSMYAAFSGSFALRTRV